MRAILTVRYIATVLLGCALTEVTPQYRTWGWELGHVVSSAFVAVLLVMATSRLRIELVCALHHRRQPPALPDIRADADRGGAPW